MVEWELDHQFLIDDGGRGWCGDECSGRFGPHWEGETPEEYYVKEGVPDHG